MQIIIVVKKKKAVKGKKAVKKIQCHLIFIRCSFQIHNLVHESLPVTLKLMKSGTAWIVVG